jgi:hypothetical protein
MTTKLAAGNDLSDYTWYSLVEDLHAADLFNRYWHDIDSAIATSVRERMIYARARKTSTAIDRYTDDERARFALNVKAFRQTSPGPITATDILDRPRHWLVAYAIANLLSGRA